MKYSRYLRPLLFLLPLLFLNSTAYSELVPMNGPPFSLEGGYVAAMPARLCEEGIEGEELRFARAETRLNYTYAMTPCFGLLMGAGYDRITLDWHKNPFFKEKHFGYVNFAIGAYTTAFCDFLWSATLAIFIDTEVLDITNYALYEGVFFGEHKLSQELRFQVGFIVESGLNNDKIWPILGFEWDGGKRWRIGAVYPLDIAIEYRLMPELSIATSARFFQSRHRLKISEPLSQGLFQYQNIGIEGSLLCHPIQGFVLNGFIGTTLKGDLKITNPNYLIGTHYKLNNALYGGLEANLMF